MVGLKMSKLVKDCLETELVKTEYKKKFEELRDIAKGLKDKKSLKIKKKKQKLENMDELVLNLKSDTVSSADNANCLKRKLKNSTLHASQAKVLLETYPRSLYIQDAKLKPSGLGTMVCGLSTILDSNADEKLRKLMNPFFTKTPRISLSQNTSKHKLSQ
ncbi:hypothetical protein K501DRAFT_336603 [Backusella circina FSU 941]|nr:hypothetical protein K501DRAFT_336603 [Backusella circina FSU 941]